MNAGFLVHSFGIRFLFVRVSLARMRDSFPIRFLRRCQLSLAGPEGRLAEPPTAKSLEDSFHVSDAFCVHIDGFRRTLRCFPGISPIWDAWP